MKLYEGNNKSFEGFLAKLYSLLSPPQLSYPADETNSIKIVVYLSRTAKLQSERNKEKKIMSELLSREAVNFVLEWSLESVHEMMGKFRENYQTFI